MKVMHHFDCNPPVDVRALFNKIFKFPPNLDPFVYVNYLLELLSDYPNNPVQNNIFGLVSELPEKDFVNG